MGNLGPQGFAVLAATLLLPMPVVAGALAGLGSEEMSEREHVGFRRTSWMDIGLLTGWLLLMPIGLILVLGDAAKLPPEVVTSALWWAALGLTAAVLLGRRLAWTAPIVVVLILALFGIDGDQPRWWALPFHAVTPATAGLAVTVYALAAGFYLWFAQRPRGRWTVMWGAAARD
ncbi:hypothetical protein FB566_4325 [Stackebrandtia endophytica]|uniref:Uncharacterized protein n=1 Tax=Stackebrandtia endophytica TaxID=1496996 RepID=A0A543B1M6_9ACTN|nr:hypothetical protein [Stackebrandtia endophytica]TQL78733.1 hypothetical protein FB566_4325 [Stackebrandtia endophytica]